MIVEATHTTCFGWPAIKLRAERGGFFYEEYIHAPEYGSHWLSKFIKIADQALQRKANA